MILGVLGFVRFDHTLSYDPVSLNYGTNEPLLAVFALQYFGQFLEHPLTPLRQVVSGGSNISIFMPSNLDFCMFA